MSDLDDILEEATLLDMKRKMGGNEAAGAISQKIGERYIQRVSLVREIDVQIAHFGALIEAATKLQPPDQKTVTELKKALRSLQYSRDLLAKSIKYFDVVMSDKSIK